MKNKFLVIGVVLLILIVLVVFLRPYSTLEKNAATVYYQSYSQLQASIDQYVGMLENYNNTEDEIYLENAIIQLVNIRDNINIFTIADNIDFRDTIINEKVVSTDFLTEKYLRTLQTHYSYSSNILEQYLGNSIIGDTSFEDFLHYNQLILTGLTTEELGYYKETKEYRVILDDNKVDLLEEGMNGLNGIMENVVMP